MAPSVKKRKPPSARTRNVRRAESPSPSRDLVSTVVHDDMAASMHSTNAGITKRRKAKHQTRHQRLRREKGLELADRNSDILAEKLVKSRARGKVIKERRAAWEDHNQAAKAEKGISTKSPAQNAFAALDGEAEDDEWEDENTPHIEDGSQEQQSMGAAISTADDLLDGIS